MRLIVSVEPSIATVERVMQLQEELAEPLRQLGGDVEWTAPEHVRLVLRVAEPAGVDERLRLRDAMRAICRSIRPFEYRVAGVRFDPDVTLARRIVAEVAAGREALEGVSRQIEAAMQAQGVWTEEVAWAPLIRLGRLRGGGHGVDLRGVLNRWESAELGASTARELVVSASSLQGERVEWKVLERLELGTGR